MANTSDIRSWCNPLRPNFSEAAQCARLTGTIYKADKRGNGRDALIRSIRPGSVVEVIELFLLAKTTGRTDVRRRDLLTAMDKIEERGGTIREVSTGDETPKHQRRMLLRAYEMIANSGRGSHSAANGALSKGRPRKQWTQEQLDAAERIWFSTRYKTRHAATLAIQALNIPMTKTFLYAHFGVPSKEPGDPTEIAKIGVQKRRRKVKTFIYFIRNGGNVKIGHSTDPQKRLNNMATSNHTELVLLATMPGDRKRERQLHKKFVKFRIKGEWFKLVPQITKYIAGLKRQRKK